MVLASKAKGKTSTNPMVGCVIVHQNKIVAEGYHTAYGKPHAEVEAFNRLPGTIPVNECDVYVSLEPCTHFGKTPPCADLIIKKRPSKVIIGSLDPNPKVAGKGAAKIKDAGIEVIVSDQPETYARLNKTFFHFHQYKTPWICLKWAETKDGFVGRHADDRDKTAQISNERNSPWVHKLRTEHQAILIGSNTAKTDNPMLNVRQWEGANPIKVILSRRNDLPKDLAMFKEGKTWVYNCVSDITHDEINYIKLPVDNFLENVMKDLADKGIQSVLVEGGAEIHNAFIEHSLWNEAFIIKTIENWVKGIAAPKLKKHNIHKEWTSHNDHIYHFVNS